MLHTSHSVFRLLNHTLGSMVMALARRGRRRMSVMSLYVRTGAGLPASP